MNKTGKHSDRLNLNGQWSGDSSWPNSFPFWVASLYIALFIIRPWEEIFPLLGYIHFERIYFIGMLLIVFFSREKEVMCLEGQTLWILFFFFVVVMSGVNALNPSLSTDPIHAYLVLVLFYFIMLVVIRNTYELVFIIFIYISVMTIYLTKAEWEFFINDRGFYRMGVNRLIGIETTYGSPNSLAMSIVVSLPFLLFLWSIRKEVTKNWTINRKKFYVRVLFLYAILAVSSIILTNSRSGMVGFLFFLLLVILGNQRGERIKKMLTCVSVLFLIWGFMPQEQKNRFSTIWDSDAGPESAQVSAQGRIDGLLAGIEMYENYPITGVGIGNFIHYRTSQGDGITLNAHNLLGQILGETGTLGLIGFLGFIGMNILNLRSIEKLNELSSEKVILKKLHIACKESLYLLLFLGLFGHNLFRFNWLWLAAFGVLGRRFAMGSLNERDLS